MPDEEVLALWVEDELQGAEAAAVEAWAATQPEWLEHRAQAREMKTLLRAHLPAAEEPPYADFFNSRISREIVRESQAGTPQTAPAFQASPRRSIWHWFLPATAVAGMVLCFWAGTKLVPESNTSGAPLTVAPVLYTPEKGVSADYSASKDAMVIVLDGVSAIPDSFEIPETAAVEAEKDEPTATAVIDTPPR